MNQSLQVLKSCNQRAVAQNHERPSEVSKGSTEFQNNQGSTFESVHVSPCGNVNSTDSSDMQTCTSVASECPVGKDSCEEPKEIEAEADAQALEKAHKDLSEHPVQYSEEGCSDANKMLSPPEESERILQHKPHSLAAKSVCTSIQSTQKDNSGHDSPSRINGVLKIILALESATVPHTNSVNVCSSSADWPSKTSISMHVDNTENETSNFEPQTLTTTLSSVVEPNSPTLLTDEPEANSDVPDVEGSLDCLKTKTSEPKLTAGRKWKCFDTSASEDLSSSSVSSDEDDTSSLSHADQLDVDDPARDEMGDIGKANSPHPAPECSVFNGCDLDVVRAYEEDAIVLDVIQDDPDLFGGIDVEGSGSLDPKDRPVSVHRGKKVSFQTEKTPVRGHKIVWDLESQSSKKTVQTPDDLGPVNREDYCTGKGNELAQDTESHLVHSRSWCPVKPIVNQEHKSMDSNNNLVNEDTSDLNVNNTADRLVVDSRNQVRTMAGKDVSVVRPLPSSYCWFYFSEHCVCLRTVCWFLHLPRDDDEQFCMNTVQKFCRNGNTPIVQRAVEVFVGYYRTNFPGVSFSQNIVNSLLSSLLSLALLGDLVSVINTLLSHKRTPHPEFVIALYKHVRERGFHSFVPELILLTSKIIEAGCVFSVEQCEIMQVQLRMLHVPRHHLEIFHAVKCRALAMNPQTAELSELAQAVVQVEVFKQQEDWSGLARVFCTVCDGRHSAVELSRFCSCVTMALLKDPKDKLTLPFEPFAASVCESVPSDGLVKSFLGRVGVSLMFNYHRTQDWSKGMKVVGVMSRLQIEFFTLKGFFSSEDEPSRCQLVTMAAELFLNSGSIEGALNMLRDNDWFVTSSAWPCDEGDVHNRRTVLIQLAGKTSHRDTLEVLTNLPGLSQPVDGVQPGEYSSVFNAHLQRCVTNQVLPVAADTLEFMLIQKIHVDTTELHHLIHKLGKQNAWSRARTLFKCAHSAGYYSAVVLEKDSLDLPCSLSEIEMTLAFEMFITRVGSILQNPTDVSQPLLITLKRGSCSEGSMESAYLAAGCRLLSAALIPNPKLSIRYTAVSQEQEQLFHLDRGSAAKWLSHNRSWAQEMWP
ncbi:protein TOPAZ1 [Trichomycterus rosablanca]|uniref:protein TOPAZ1 n=1 Tax=Trichomycterus rosablanca TaxID=2290929 RepID=UPI002F35B7D7